MEDLTHESLVGAGITPKERLERIEQLLAKIDEKLDGKANLHDLYALQLRMEVIEKEFAEHKTWASQLLNQLPRIEYSMDSLNEGCLCCGSGCNRYHRRREVHH